MKKIYTLTNPDDSLPLKLEDGPVCQIVRLLCGYVDIERLFPQKTYEHRIVLSSGDVVDNPDLALGKIEDFARWFDLSVDDFILQLKSIKGRNDVFYEELLAEIVGFCIRRDEGNETLAFLHFYRMLERFSFCFPMIFSAKTKDFMRAHADLKSYFKEGNELAFFKKFLNQNYAEDYRDVEFVLDYNHFGHYVENLESIFSNKEMDFKVSLSDGRISLQLVPFYEFVLNSRNRYFHYMSGRVNILSEQIVCSDSYFQPINKEAMSWFSIIFMEVLLVIMSS